MPYRIVPLVNGEYYHIYNRGVAKLPIFSQARNYSHFINTFLYYQFSDVPVRFSQFDPKIHSRLSQNRHVELICYCLMPNHFHFLVRQTQDNGITIFMSKLSNSYTRYYNIQYLRIGPLFQGEFKAVRVESQEQLIHLSRYIHINPITNYLVKNLSAYRWSSYREYIGLTSSNYFVKEAILNNFPSKEEYRRFTLDQVEYAKQLELIKHKALDFEE